MQQRKILILFAHPRYENSIVQKSLLSAVKNLPFVTVHDLYETYPDFDIDIKREQQLLIEHDIIVWQHPFYWYSCPPLLKQWIDLVLSYGWAYGKNGTQLANKIVFNAISAGGSYEVYQPDGRNRFTITDFLLPFNQTAYLCKMQYLPPYVIHQANKTSATVCSNYAAYYADLLQFIATQPLESILALQGKKYLNIRQYQHHE